MAQGDTDSCGPWSENRTVGQSQGGPLGYPAARCARRGRLALREHARRAPFSGKGHPNHVRAVHREGAAGDLLRAL
jgi:hypothetical protein